MNTGSIKLTYGRTLDLSACTDLELADSIITRLQRIEALASAVSELTTDEADDVAKIADFIREIAGTTTREVMELHGRHAGINGAQPPQATTGTEPAPLDAMKAGLEQVQEGLQRMRAQGRAEV